MLPNLKQLRRQHGISQKRLASEVGVSQQSINKYENHNIEPDIATLIHLADYFHTTVDYLIGRADSPDTEVRHICELNMEEVLFLAHYRKLNPQKKQLVSMIVDSFLETQHVLV